MNSFIQIQWTAAHLDEAREISQALVLKGWVACASIFPLVESWFIWEGELEQASEVKVLLKTVENYYSKIESYIKKNHSYQVPEIIMFYIDQGYEPYLKWMSQAMTKA